MSNKMKQNSNVVATKLIVSHHAEQLFFFALRFLNFNGG